MKKFDHKLNPIFFKESIGTSLKDNAKRFSADDLIYLEVEKLKPNKSQPRKIFDEHAMLELKASIEAQGILQPILARYNRQQDCYEIIAGERRLMAAKLAFLTHVPVLIARFDDEESAVFAIVENIQRQDLSTIEEAKAYNKLIKEFSLTHEEIAKKVGKSRSFVTNLLRILGLPENIKEGIMTNQIQLGHAKIILSIDNNESREDFYKVILSNGLSVRDCEKRVKQFQKKKEYNIYSVSTKTKNVIDSTNNSIENIEKEIAFKFSRLLQQSVIVEINNNKETLIKINDVKFLIEKLNLLLQEVMSKSVEVKN